MRKELDELQKLHEDGKKAVSRILLYLSPHIKQFQHRAEIHQLKSELERQQKTSTDQIAALKKQADTADSKTQECRKSLLSAQSEINEMRLKLRSQDKQKATSIELENLKKTIDGLESSKREREGKISELEKALHTESKKRTLAEEKLKETGSKASTVDAFKQRLDDALSQLAATQAALDFASTSSTEEIDDLKRLLCVCAELYGTLAAQAVRRSELEGERLLRYDLQSRSVKMERRLMDKDAQLQELVAYLRCKDDQQRLLQASLADAEKEIAFLRESLNVTAEQSLEVETEAQFLLLDDMTDTNRLMEADLSCARVMEEYHQEWARTLLDEYKSAAHCAGSLEAALSAVLERTAELDGQLQVAHVEAATAVKRAKDADVQVSSLQREIENVKERKEQQILDLATEKDTLAEQGDEARRKWEDARRKLERLESVVREKIAAEKALSDDVEGFVLLS
jgi:chromosome segregation ATPase